MPAQLQERRILNEEIENSFILAAKAAANLETKLSHGKGSIFGDSQDFYQHFSYLVRLTMQLKELEAKDGSELDILKKKIDAWKKRKMTTNNPTEMEYYVTSGLELFDQYYKSLMHFGVIALPTKKG